MILKRAWNTPGHTYAGGKPWQAAIWGTPDRILRELEARRAVLGDFELNTAFRFGGVPYDTAERGLKLFAKEVLPVLKTWRT